MWLVEKIFRDFQISLTRVNKQRTNDWGKWKHSQNVKCEQKVSKNSPRYSIALMNRSGSFNFLPVEMSEKSHLFNYATNPLLFFEQTDFTKTQVFAGITG